MINSHPKEASDTPTTRVIFGGRNLKCLAPVSYSGRWLTLTCWGALEKCQWLLFRKTIFKGITNTDVHLQLSFLGKMEMEWTWEIAGRRFMVFAISRKHRNEVGGIQKRAKAFVLTPYQWKSTWMRMVLSEIFRKCKKSWPALFFLEDSASSEQNTHTCFC